MKTIYPELTESFREYMRLLIQLHELNAAKLSESHEGEALRERMDDIWSVLSEEEILLARGFSADLSDLFDFLFPRTIGIKPKDPQFQTAFRSYLLAFEQGNILESLNILREWKEYFQPSYLCSLRCEIWRKAGEFDIAQFIQDSAASIQNG